MKLQARMLRLIILTMPFIGASNVWAQSHTAMSGPYELRASTVVSTSIPESSARKNGIERDPRRGILNVTLIKHEGKTEKTMKADVQAHVRDLSGQQRDVALRETTANSYISYTGTYDFVNSEVLDFTINAKPAGESQNVTLVFRDRMWVPKSALPQQ